MDTAECIVNGGFLQELPDDVLALVSAALSPQDVVRLGTTCRKLRRACLGDKLWLPHCERMGLDIDLRLWRDAMSSFQSIWRFVTSIRSLVGLWVRQNPELGNLVYVTWGFVSVVAVRIIPQELGPHGLDKGLLWAPVFEIIGQMDGSLAFFLHGRENNKDYVYPGRFHSSSSNPNVLLLEAEPLAHDSYPSRCAVPHSPKSLLGVVVNNGEDFAAEACPKRPLTSKGGDKGKKNTSVQQFPFHRLSFGVRRRLLEKLALQIALQVPGLASGPLFPHATPIVDGSGEEPISPEDRRRRIVLLAERRARLLWLFRYGNVRAVEQQSEPVPGSGCEGVDAENLFRSLCTAVAAVGDSTAAARSKSIEKVSDSGLPVNGLDSSKKQLSLARLFMGKMRQMIGKNTGEECGSERGAGTGNGSNSQERRLQLQEFLKQSRSVGLRLQATSWKLNFYRAWPIMHNDQFALYKIPEQKPVIGRDYAGLWVGTFGWPPGQPDEDKPGKAPGRALFFLLLSYEEMEEGRLLIATKILEGTHYVLYPNGSAMFTAKVDQVSSEPFPWVVGGNCSPVNVVHAFQGEGIANGYGFRYPGSKPGDLFEDDEGSLAFVWRESKAVLTLKRLNLQRLLDNGERVPALPPVANFAYLTSSHHNVFAGSCGPTNLGILGPKTPPAIRNSLS